MMLDLDQFKEWQESTKDKASIRAYCIRDGKKTVPSLLAECRLLQESNHELAQQRDKLLDILKSVLDIHLRRKTGFAVEYEIEIMTEEYATNLIAEIEATK